MKTILIFIIIFSFYLSVNTDTGYAEDTILPSKTRNESGRDDQKNKTTEQEIEDLKIRVSEIEDLKEEIDLLKKQIEILRALEISGFFDVNISNYKNKPNIFSIGSFELDIEHNYKYFQVAAALVFDEGAELGVGFIDYHIFGSRISPRGRLFQGEGFHIQIGKFDIPFGNDWYDYSPAERITVTPPLTTDIIMEGGYNDEGVRMLLNLVSFNVTLYMLDGIEQKYTFGGNSFGGRIGITPFSNPFELKSRSIPSFETGFSYILDIDRDGATAEKLYAADIKSKIGPIILSSEYYNRDKNVGILLYGYHITTGLDINYFLTFPVIIYGRYEQCFSEEIVSVNSTEGTDKNSLTRLTAGLNINISDISYLKMEYQNYLSAYREFEEDQYYSKILYYLQLVITF